MTDPNRLIDLDAVLSPDIEVSLNGKSYRLPGDAPTEDMLNLLLKAERLEKNAEGGEETPEQLLEAYEELSADVEDLFRIKQPDLEEGEIRLTGRQLGELLGGLTRIYNEALSAGQPGEGGGRPTATPPKPRSARRSRGTSSGRTRSRAKPQASASSTSSQT